MRAIGGVLILGLAIGAGAAQKPPLTDGLVYDRVIRKIANDPEMKTTAIEVSVKERVVTLRGMVDSEKLRLRAERTAVKTDGVKKVVNELRVRP